MELKNRWALITGASSGIGKAISQQLAKNGCHVILMARREARIQELSHRLQSDYGIEAVPIAVDVSDFKKTNLVFKERSSEFGKIDILVNNAGLAIGTGSFAEQNFEDWQTVINTNVLGLLNLTKAALPALRKKPEAHIINIGSVAGRWVYPGGAVYCASKFAVRALSEGMRLDLMGQPIRITNIEPGMAETEFSLVRLKDQVKAQQVYQGMTPLTADDIAESVLWCLQRPKHVNVAELVIYPTDQAGVSHVHRRSD